MAELDYAIDLRNVEKIYRGRVYALRGIEMRVGRGEIFGLLGPNGAGKSTLVKIMMTVVRPTRAEGTVLGQPIGHKPTLGRVGYLPENHRFPRYLTGRQTLQFFGSLAGISREHRERRAGELLETVGMSAWADRRIGTYSKGMMQRIGLAHALVNDPDLVVLDEPTDGVDPVGRREIRDVLSLLRQQGKTVFINSHLLSELEVVCNRVAILVSGTVARQGTIDELTVAKQRYEIDIAGSNGALEAMPIGQLIGAQFSSPPPMPAAPSDAKSSPAAPVWRGRLAGGQWIEFQDHTLRIGTTEAAELQPLIDSLRQAGLTIRRVQSVRPSLEDLFMATIHGGPSGGR